MRTSAAAAIVAAVCCLLAAAPARAGGEPDWQPVHERQSRGNVSATLDYERWRISDDYSTYRNMRLRISRAGRQVYDRVVCRGVGCQPGGFAGGARRGLILRNVWGSAEPEVLVETYSGGAHCCRSTVILSRGGAGYRQTRHAWGDLAYQGQWRQGVYYFLSGDPGFAYAFTPFAASAYPAQVWALTAAGRLRNVTRERLDYVRGNAARHWKTYTEQRGGEFTIRGFLAAWCADQYLLDDGEACEAELVRARAEGWLETEAEDSSVAEYLAKLHRYLRVGGYIRG